MTMATMLTRWRNPLSLGRRVAARPGVDEERLENLTRRRCTWIIFSYSSVNDTHTHTHR